MKLFILFLLFINFAVSQRGMAFQQSVSLNGYIWNAPAGAGVSLAGAEYRRNHPNTEPSKVLLFNGCARGNCDSNVWSQ